LLSFGFQYKALADSSKDGFDFRAGEKVDDKPEVATNELELLEYVRFTETFDELDTLTISPELARDPERFIQICSTIAGTTFMRVCPQLDILDQKTG
jgi:hypothetical protein